MRVVSDIEGHSRASAIVIGMFSGMFRQRAGYSNFQVSSSTNRATFGVMARSLHVRLDDASEAALRTLRAQGMSDSEAVRVALREGAARRLSRSALAEEVQRIASDEADRAEMLAIRDHLAELAPPKG
jgi:hypothetical protein